MVALLPLATLVRRPTTVPRLTADPLTLCNACDAATANPSDPAGYCDECRSPGALEDGYAT